MTDMSSGSSASVALLNRLRAGSMPQRANFPSMFGVGPSVFSPGWQSTRERSSTLASIQSQGSNTPSSPQQSTFSQGNGDSDLQMRTLDYLGLADTPQPPRATLVPNPFIANLIDVNKQASRFRSYSVNAAQEKYPDEEDDEYDMIPAEYQARLQYELAQTNAAIAQHNLAVQAFANQASANRPRARTAGVLDSPGSRVLQNYYRGPSHLENSMTAKDLGMNDEYDGLPEAVQALRLGGGNPRLVVDDSSQDSPTSALWLGNIPSSTTVSTLSEMFKAHGAIASVRVLTHKNCGFVNFERVESAVMAKQALNGKEVFPGAGPVRINFAKPVSSASTPGHDGQFASPSPDPFAKTDKLAAEGSTLRETSTGPAHSVSRSGEPVTIPPLHELRSEILEIVRSFGATEEDIPTITALLTRAIVSSDNLQTEIPPVAEPSPNRIHDAPKLRDIRKKIDNNSLSPTEIEQIAIDMLPEIAELSSDYLGNTVVQKLYESCSDPIRTLMLEAIAPHLASIGTHKNGTWAAQKIIDVSSLPSQQALIAESLAPYTVPLFLDQFGNYVLQGCLRFQSPASDFVFETMCSRMWEISQGRYGARAMRACLESHFAGKEQTRLVAAAVVVNSVRLAENQNAALLLTWFLDTCNFPNRRTVLAPRLVRSLVGLCTHKTGYLTVLKVINQRAELEARDLVLRDLFFSEGDAILRSILSDPSCGASFVFKVLTTPFFDEGIRGEAVERVRNVLVAIGAMPGMGYKRLMDEVGLSTRGGSAGPSGRDRDGRGHGHGHAGPRLDSAERRPASQPRQQQQQQPEVQIPSQPQAFATQVPYGQLQHQLQQQHQHQHQHQHQIDMQRADSVDSTRASFAIPSGVSVPALQGGYQHQHVQLGGGMGYQQQPAANANANVLGGMPLTPLNQLQFQQLGGRGPVAAPVTPVNGFFPGQQMPMNGLSGMQGGYGGYGAQAANAAALAINMNQAAAYQNGGVGIGSPHMANSPIVHQVSVGGYAPQQAAHPHQQGYGMNGLGGVGASGMQYGYPQQAMGMGMGMQYPGPQDQGGRRGRVAYR